MENFVKVAGIIVLTMLSIFVSAWTFSTLWLWFVTPFSLPSIGYAHAYGLLLIAGILKLKPRDFEDDEKTKDGGAFERSAKRLILNVIVCLTLVGFGWVTTLFM